MVEADVVQKSHEKFLAFHPLEERQQKKNQKSSKFSIFKAPSRRLLNQLP